MALKLPETDHEFMTAMLTVARQAASEALIGANLVKPYLKLREAQRLYGTATVKRWHQEGLITFMKDGNGTSSIRIERSQIEAVARTSNRITYLPTSERGGKSK